MLSQKVLELLQPLYAYRRMVVMVSIVSILLGLVPPYFMGVLTYEIGSYSPSVDHNTYFFIIGTIAAFLIIHFFVDWARGYLWADLINKGAGLTRSFFFENVLHKKYSFFHENHTGDINNKVINDSYIYVQSKLAIRPRMILDLGHIVVIFIILFTLNPYMKLMTLMFSVAFLFVYMLLNKHLRNHSIKEREGFSALMDEASETITGINTIQLYTAEDYFAKHFEKAVDRYENKLGNLKFWQTLSKSATEAISSIIPLAAIAAGVVHLVSGGNITIESILAFYYFLPNLKTPIKELADFNISLQNAKAVEKRLEQILEREDIDTGNCEDIQMIEKITFKDLCFTYENGKEAIKNLNVDLQRGDILTITGSSGTGKSTLLRLLKRQIEPTSGSIYVNDRDYMDIKRSAYIRKISVVTQEVFVFDASIHDNISFSHKYPEIRVRQAAELSMLEHVSLDENALGLSGGESQRIGLARAIASDYDVLILDEPTSELDELTESKVIESLKKIQAETNKIMIVVTHSQNVIENLSTKQINIGNRTTR